MGLFTIYRNNYKNTFTEKSPLIKLTSFYFFLPSFLVPLPSYTPSTGICVAGMQGEGLLQSKVLFLELARNNLWPPPQFLDP